MLLGKNFAFLATINRDGSPHVTPTWVDTDGSYVLINTALGRVKVKNIRRDPRVAVAIADQTNPERYTMIRGRVVRETVGKAAEDHINKLARKYTGAERFVRQSPTQRRVILSIRPDHVVLPE
jgi:PPOX class probable F420-dependent enzyme